MPGSVWCSLGWSVSRPGHLFALDGVAFGPLPATIFAASQWHEYFMTVGGGAAALTGLVFVAMTLHLDEVINNPVHRHRARTILAGLTAVFIRCALALMGGQNAQAVAVALIAVLVVVEIILYRSIREAAPAADNAVLLRAIGRFPCLLLEQPGALVLFFRFSFGLYAVPFALMPSFIFMATGAWLLLVGVGMQEAAEAKAAS